MRDQRLDGRTSARFRGEKQRRRPIEVACIDGSAVFKEQFDDLRIARFSGAAQRVSTKAIPRLQGSAGLQQASSKRNARLSAAENSAALTSSVVAADLICSYFCS